MAALGGWRLTRAGILFVIGILVLGGLVTGGIFLAKNRGEAVRRDQAVKVAEQTLKDQSSSDSSGTAKSTDDTGTQTNSGATGTSTTPANTGATTTATAPSALPVTGPDTLVELGNILAVTILALSVAFYISSRSSHSKTNSRL